MDALFHRSAPEKRCGFIQKRIASRNSAAIATRREITGEFPVKRVLRLRFARFDTQNRVANPVFAHFHSTFGCDFHRIASVSSAQGVCSHESKTYTCQGRGFQGRGQEGEEDEA
jgi:hypothetical protein